MEEKVSSTTFTFGLLEILNNWEKKNGVIGHMVSSIRIIDPNA